MQVISHPPRTGSILGQNIIIHLVFQIISSMYIQFPILISKCVRKTTPIGCTAQTDIHITQFPVSIRSLLHRIYNSPRSVFVYPFILCRPRLRIDTGYSYFFQLIDIVPFIKGLITVSCQLSLIEFGQFIVVITESEGSKPIEVLAFQCMGIQNEFKSPVFHLPDILILLAYPGIRR